MQLVLGGLLAGLIHVLTGPDHLAAVAPYATLERKRAWQVGFRWGMGHTSGVLVIGILTLLVRQILPIDRLSGFSEQLVGWVLLGIGLWGIWTAKRLGSPELASKRPKAHTHAAFGVGILHGLAGSSHLLGILPALALPTTVAAGVWLGLFGIGTVLGMTAYAAVIGYTADCLEPFGDRGYRALLTLCACAAIAVGVYWLMGGSRA